MSIQDDSHQPCLSQREKPDLSWFSKNVTKLDTLQVNNKELEKEKVMSHRGGKLSLDKLEPSKKQSIQNIVYGTSKTGRLSGVNATSCSPRIKRDVTERFQI